MRAIDSLGSAGSATTIEEGIQAGFDRNRQSHLVTPYPRADELQRLDAWLTGPAGNLLLRIVEAGDRRFS